MGLHALPTVICQELLELFALQPICFTQAEHMAAVLRQEVEEHAAFDVFALPQHTRHELALGLPQQVAKAQGEDGELLG